MGSYVFCADHIELIKPTDLETEMGQGGQLGDLNFSEIKSLTASDERTISISRGKIRKLVTWNNIVTDFNSKEYFSWFEVVVCKLLF